MRPIIVWFRRDLRTSDNSALYYASKTGLPIVPLYIFDKKIIDSLSSDGAVFNFQAEALRELDNNLKQLGSALIVRYGNVDKIHEKIIKEVNPSALYFNRDYDPSAIQRDEIIKKLYNSYGIEVKTFKDFVLLEPNEVVTLAGKPYAVFTPYANAWKKNPISSPLGKPNNFRTIKIKSESILNANDLKKRILISKPLLVGGESIAKKRWKYFLTSLLKDYRYNRDIPAVDGTSRMSAYLRVGCISIRQMYEDVANIIENKKESSLRNSAYKYLDELIWREFYQSVIFHFPWVVDSNYRKQFNKMPWRYNKKLLNAWEKGNTGYPLVDAGMRQLNTTGWMHNRVRMVVASFLTKDLMHNWKLGAQYFEEKLLDIETASNNGGWQWSASTGVDPKPLRIFNPRLQSEKFDPNGDYIKHWVPELEKVPIKFIHTPHEMPTVLQKEIGCVIGKHYPTPIVEHSAASKFYKEAFFKIRM